MATRTRKYIITATQKQCRKCLELKSKEYFYIAANRSGGVRDWCISCEKEYNANYHAKNSAAIVERHKKNHQKDPDKRTKYEKTKRHTDPIFKLKKNLRRRLHGVLKGKIKKGSSIELLGCTPKELKTYLESKFKPGMSWDNYNFNGFHIDHIKPLSSFDLTDFEQLKQACHYTNLQPLWAKENLIKSDKIIPEVKCG